MFCFYYEYLTGHIYLFCTMFYSKLVNRIAHYILSILSKLSCQTVNMLFTIFRIGANHYWIYFMKKIFSIAISIGRAPVGTVLSKWKHTWKINSDANVKKY